MKFHKINIVLPTLFTLLFVCPLIVKAQTKVTLSGQILDKSTAAEIPYAQILLIGIKDSTPLAGVLTNEQGRFNFLNITPGKYKLRVTYMGYKSYLDTIFIGTLSPNLDLGNILLVEETLQLENIEIIGKQDELSSKMDKKSYSLGDNLTQTGGTILQAIQNLPGVTVQEGKVQIRGSDQVIVMVDGKQTALTGFGNQTNLDNIPASSIDKIEIINNPSAKFDANGNAGIINIIYKKNKQEGFNGKIGSNQGVGAVWIKKGNLPLVSAQYQNTPKINPSVSLNYKTSKINVFLQSDYLYTQTLNKNEFVDRYYNDGTILRQQTRRNRNTSLGTGKTGIDWTINENNHFSISALGSVERIID
jgi:hypothetical protein